MQEGHTVVLSPEGPGMWWLHEPVFNPGQREWGVKGDAASTKVCEHLAFWVPAQFGLVFSPSLLSSWCACISGKLCMRKVKKTVYGYKKIIITALAGPAPKLLLGACSSVLVSAHLCGYCMLQIFKQILFLLVHDLVSL